MSEYNNPWLCSGLFANTETLIRVEVNLMLIFWSVWIFNFVFVKKSWIPSGLECIPMLRYINDNEIVKIILNVMVRKIYIFLMYAMPTRFPMANIFIFCLYVIVLKMFASCRSATHEVNWPWCLKNSRDQVNTSFILFPPLKC